jgi:predicted alpha/beta-hydrolase family hydrolase
MNGEDDAGRVTKPRTAQRAQLGRHADVVGPVRSLAGGKFTGGNGATVKRVVGLHKAIADVRAAHAGRPLFLASQSSGGRIIAHAFAGLWQTKPQPDGTTRRFRLGEVPPAGAASKGVVKDARALYDQFPQFCDPPGRAPDGVAGVLLFGYPLHHKNQDRSPPLRGMVAAGVPVLVVSGDKDPFNVGLAEVVADMGNVDVNNSHTAATFVEIAGGGHDVWSPFDAARHAAIHSAVSAFMSDCWAAS